MGSAPNSHLDSVFWIGIYKVDRIPRFARLAHGKLQECSAQKITRSGL
jgi:hypothetical protein